MTMTSIIWHSITHKFYSLVILCLQRGGHLFLELTRPTFISYNCHVGPFKGIISPLSVAGPVYLIYLNAVFTLDICNIHLLHINSIFSEANGRQSLEVVWEFFFLRLTRYFFLFVFLLFFSFCMGVIWFGFFYAYQSGKHKWAFLIKIYPLSVVVVVVVNFLHYRLLLKNHFQKNLA